MKYEWLLNFDKAMIDFAKKNKVVKQGHAENLWLDEKSKIIAFARGDLLYVFQFSPERIGDQVLPAYASDWRW